MRTLEGRSLTNSKNKGGLGFTPEGLQLEHRQIQRYCPQKLRIDFFRKLGDMSERGTGRFGKKRFGKNMAADVSAKKNCSKIFLPKRLCRNVLFPYHRGKYKISNNYNFNVRSLERYSSRWFNIGLVLAMYRASIISKLLTFVHRSSTVAVTSPVLTAHSPKCLPSSDDFLLCSPSLVITCLVVWPT